MGRRAGHRGGMRAVAAEAVLVAAGGRAILLQLADPRVARGVARHSDFVDAPLRRLTGTLDYIYVVVYGTDEERAAARRHVERAHAPVRSTPGESMAYAADDASLQLWVAATLYDSAMAMHERVLRPLDPVEAERVYREYAVLGAALGMPAGLWPATIADFRRWWDDRLAGLSVSDEARSVAADLLHPRSPGAPLWLRAGMPLGRLVTAGLLDDRLRRAFDLPWSPRRQRLFDVVVTVLRVVWPFVPRGVRHAPAIRSLRRLRRRRATG